MKSLLMLFLVVFLGCLALSAAVGVIAFFVDIIRFGLPHEKASVCASVDAYEARLAKKEAEFAESVNDAELQPLEL